MDRHLDYAPLPPRFQRKVFRRTVSLTLLAVLGAIFAWKGGPPAWQRVRLLYWQRQAMKYTRPSDQTVYDETAGVIWIVHAKPWEQLCEVLSSSRFEKAMLFLHEMHNSLGQTRLVAVEGSASSFWPRPAPLGVNVCVIRPGGAFTQPTAITDRVQSLNLRLQDSDPVHCYAGQADPADPSHFTVKCEVKDRSIIIDGWLQNDDTVKLEPRRQSALTSPAPSSAARSR